MNSDDSFLDLPRGIREVALELLLSEDPADKRRIAQLERISRARGISFEAMFTQAIDLQNEVEDDDEDADWWKES
jgi:hypothetical protein